MSTYQIVGTHEANINNGRLSVTAPLARALIGKSLGDSVEVVSPGGAKFYEITKVNYK
jgi:transcription elongation factor GreA